MCVLVGKRWNFSMLPNHSHCLYLSQSRSTNHWFQLHKKIYVLSSLGSLGRADATEVVHKQAISSVIGHMLWQIVSHVSCYISRRMVESQQRNKQTITWRKWHFGWRISFPDIAAMLNVQNLIDRRRTVVHIPRQPVSQLSSSHLGIVYTRNG